MGHDDDDLGPVGDRPDDGEGTGNGSGGLWEASLDLCLLIDAGRRILRVNTAGAAALGYAPEDVVGRPWTDFVHPDDLERGVEEDERARRERGRHARREAPELAPIDLRGPIAEMARTLGTLLGEGIEVRVAGDEQLWRVCGDRALVEQSLLNLAFNGRDAMPEGGSLTISAHNVEVSNGSRPDPTEGRHVRLAVTDTGHGMTPEVASLALEPFFTTKAKGQGTGLGLATVWATATTAGGTVEIDSVPGKGTTVAMVFYQGPPCASASSPRASARCSPCWPTA